MPSSFFDEIFICSHKPRMYYNLVNGENSIRIILYR